MLSGTVIDGPGKIENGVGAVAVKETLRCGAAPLLLIIPHDLSRGVNGLTTGVEAPWGIDRRVFAVAVEEAMFAPLLPW